VYVGIVFSVIYLILFLFMLALVAYLVVSWIQAFAPDWRPRGVLAVVLESIFSVVDPPIKMVRRVVPMLTIGNFRLDLAFMIVFFVTWLLLSITGAFAA
jgi:YggT family protein